MSSSQPFDKKFIQDLAKMLSDCDLTEIEIEHEKSKLRVAREVKQNIYATPPQMQMPHATAPQAAIVPATAQSINSDSPKTSTDNVSGEAVKSPMVGTVYLAQDPESPPFVKVGDSVKKGQTIMIVEAMKVMNNIPASKSGTIKAITVSDKEPVEFDQTLVIID